MDSGTSILKQIYLSLLLGAIIERKNGIEDWTFVAETNLKKAKLTIGKFCVSFRMEHFQRLANIFKMANYSLMGPSFFNSSHKNTS